MTLETSNDTYVFFSYAQRDKALRDLLENHLSNLKYRGLITTWHDREIGAGEERARQIDIYLNNARIILLLISVHFMASEYCYGLEMKQALERHRRGEVQVIPILLRPVLFTDAPFAGLQMLPTNGKPVVKWSDRDSAFVDIARGIERIALIYKKIEKQSEAGTRSYDAPGHSAAIPTPGIPKGIEKQSEAGTRSYDGPFASTSAFDIPSSNFRNYQEQERQEQQKQDIVQKLTRLTREVAQELKQQRWREALEEQKWQGTEVAQKQGRQDPEVVKKRQYYEDALKAYNNATTQNPSDSAAFRGLGNTYFALQWYAAAFDAFRQAIYLQPMAAAAWASIGDILAKLQQHRQAVEAYEEALRLDATVTLDYDALVRALMALGRVQVAESYRERARELGYYDE